MQRFDLIEDADGDAELMPCDTGRLVWLKDVEEERKRVREAVEELTEMARATANEIRFRGYPNTASKLCTLANEADKAVQG